VLTLFSFYMYIISFYCIFKPILHHMSLTDELIASGYLKTSTIIKAFKLIKRYDFLVSKNHEEAEINEPVSIGFGQTISQPLTVAFMLELLQPEAGQKILDIGSGSGWTTAILASIFGNNGHVYAVERLEELKKFGEKNMAKYNFVKKGIVQFFCADGYLGLPDFAPFDRILVSAAAETIPEKLVEQLSVGGIMVVPIGGQFEAQDIVKVKKLPNNKVEIERFPGFAFVPLLRK
jgi:protein-L-isoaspartate(D-aspartate) O-methyltransferase